MAALALMAGAVVASSLPSQAASTSTVVTATIPSATTLVDQCTTAAASQFGTVLPGSPGLTSTTAPCRFQFSSSNNSAQLRVRQADSMATAMVDDSGTLQEARFADRMHNDIAIEPGVPATAWTVDLWGGAFRTTDSGASWSQLADPLTATGGDSCYSIAVVTSSTAWLGCRNGKVARSTTTGSSWVGATVVPGADDVTAIGAAIATGAVAGTDSGELFYTTDTGSTWVAATGEPADADWVTDVEMVDASNGYALTNPNGRLSRTTDGGASWTELALTGPSASCERLDAVSATVAWVGCDGGLVRRTIDGVNVGAVAGWPDTRYMLHAVGATSATNATAVGAFGGIFRTTDGGATWIDETSVTVTDLRAAAAAGTRVYAVGFGDLIIASTDSGDTWSIGRGPASGMTLLDVDMVPGGTAWAVGERGRVRRSVDGGANWSSQTSGTTAHLRGVVAISSTTAIAVGSGGTVLRTVDSGTTWTPVVSGTTERLMSVDVSANGTIVAVGTQGVAIRSDDNGATWTTVRSAVDGPDDLNVIVGLGDGTFLLGGDDVTLERSTNDGRSFAALPPTGASGWLDYVGIAASYDASTILVTASDWNENFRSTNSGATWSSVPGLDALGVRGGSIEYHGNGVISGGAYAEYFTSGDLGTTIRYEDNWSHMGGFAALDSSRSIQVGQGGAIHYTQPATPISDYGAGGTWGSASTTSMFGVCLQAVGGSAIADWTVDAANTAGRCEALDSDPWRAVTTTASQAAHTTAAGQTGSIDVVWGFRPATNTPAGTYRAKVAVEVLAP